MSSFQPPTADYAGIPLPEVRILTTRLLGAETTEKVLRALEPVPYIRQINMTGESIPAVIGNGPAKGLPNNHTERTMIKFNGKDVELRHLVGAFFLELEVTDEETLDETVALIRKICDKAIPFGYTIDVGRFSKYKPSMHDYRGA